MTELLLFAALTALPGCKLFSPGCIIQDAATNAFTKGTAKILSCKNEAAIRLKMEAFVKTWGLCSEPTKTGPIANVICPIAAEQAEKWLNNLGSEKIPKDWECDPSLTIAAAKAVFTTACMALPF